MNDFFHGAGMDWILSSAWLIAGIAVGVGLTLALGPAQRHRQSLKAKLALADSQQRRALDRMRESNQELASQLQTSAKRHEQQLLSLRKAHVTEQKAVEDELKRVRAQMLKLSEAAEEGSAMSGTAFQATQFDDSDNPA
jgi:outer membrane PBP1 activator LpoA protein